MLKNGLLDFSNKIYKADFKRSKAYIGITAVTMAFIFNLINISYSDIYSKSNQVYRIEVYDFYENLFVYEYPVQLLQKEVLLIVILLTIFFAAICNKNFLRRRSKELGFIMTNGGSQRTVYRYLSYITGKCYLTAFLVAIFLSFLAMPIFSFIISKTNSSEINLFTFNFEGFYVSLAYIFIQYAVLLVLNASFICKNEILDIMNDEKNIEMKDNRQFKFPTTIFIILYFIPIICFFNIDNYKGVEHVINYTTIIAIVGVLGFIRFFLPKIIKKMKRKKLMYKGERRIYISNFLYSMSNSIIYIIAFLSSLTYFTWNLIKFKDYEGMIEITIFAMFFTSMLIALSLLYKLIVDTNEKMYLYYQLKTIGYSKKHILGIIAKESLLFFCFSMALPTIIILVNILSYKKVNLYNWDITLVLILVIVIPIIIVSFFSVKINKKRVEENLYGIEK